MCNPTTKCINAYTTHPECMSAVDCNRTYKENTPPGREVKTYRWTAVRNQRGICPGCSGVISHGELEVTTRADLDEKLPYLLPLLHSASHIALHGECNRARHYIIRMIKKGEWYDDDVEEEEESYRRNVIVTSIRYSDNGHKRRRIN